MPAGRPKLERVDSERMLLRGAEEVAEYDAASLLATQGTMDEIVAKARVAQAGWDPEHPSSEVIVRLRSLEADAARIEEVAATYRDRMVLLATIIRDLAMTSDERATANNIEQRALDLHHVIILKAMTVWRLRMTTERDENDAPELVEAEDADE